MRRATITEAKNQLSALIDYVRAGRSVVILDRGRPVARLEPSVGVRDDPDGRLARLERSGLVTVGHASPPEGLLEKPPPRPKKRVSALKHLLDERREGR